MVNRHCHSHTQTPILTTDRRSHVVVPGPYESSRSHGTSTTLPPNRGRADLILKGLHLSLIMRITSGLRSFRLWNASLLLIMLLFLLVTAASLAAANPCMQEGNTAADSLAHLTFTCHDERQYVEHPILCHWLDAAAADLDGFVQQARDWAATHGLLADMVSTPTTQINMLSASNVTLSTERRRLRENNRTSAPQTRQPARPTRAPNSSPTHGPTRGPSRPTRPKTRSPTASPTPRKRQHQLPVVFAHGIGDSCFNDGFLRLLQRTRDILGNDVYVTCIPTADNQKEDTKNGFFLNWNASVDIFHAKVQRDEHLKDGFHAIGLSQGANLIRGYIAKYNEPSVHTFLAINGVNAGIGAVPYCIPERLIRKGHVNDVSKARPPIESSWSLCDLLMEQASKSAYTCFAQEHSFPANYWRDPRMIAAERYQIYSQLAWFNQEGYDLRQDFKDNWSKTQAFVWIQAEDDGLVWPPEGEWWGAPDPRDPFNRILPRNETRWYRDDLFGLRTAEEAGKNHYESFPGDHLKFSNDDYERWIKTYIRSDDSH